MKKIQLIFFILSILSISSCKKDISIVPNELEDWNKMKMYDDYTIWFPDRFYYEGGYFIGDDSWGFKNVRSDSKVWFGYEAGPGTGDTPMQITYPLPDTITMPVTAAYSIKFSFTINSIFTNEELGVAYVRETGAWFRDKDLFFFIKNDSAYTLGMRVDYAESETEEVKLILSTIEAN